MIANNKLDAFKKKVDNLVIGKIGSVLGLGQEFIVKKYSYTLNRRGEDTKTQVCAESVRGVIVDLNHDNTMTYQDLVVHKNDLRIIFSSDVVLESGADYIYELEYNGNTYIISPIENRGTYSTNVVYKEVFASLKKN